VEGHATGAWPRIGVLALQGAFAAHAVAFADLDIDTIEVRRPADLDAVDALAIPGGESTVMSKLLDSSGLRQPLADRLAAGMPVLGTCAGMILMASDVLDARPDQQWFSAIDITVRRNGYGRQIDSFETDLEVAGVAGPDAPMRAAFIRAPIVERVGADVEVLAIARERAVVCRQGAVLVAAFHPELTTDRRLHAEFIRMASAAPSGASSTAGAFSGAEH
jgi:pyridoxal 5'-phosphate synthase pdxT subunit